MTTGAWAQVNPTALTSPCTGTQGANLFPAGDFGSGATLIGAAVSAVPSAYTYTPQASLQPGYYTRTQNTNAAPCWFSHIADNSGTSTGYFLFIDALETPAGTYNPIYTETISGFIPNTTYNFSADIANMYVPCAGSSCCANAATSFPRLQFSVNGVVLYTMPAALTQAQAGQWLTQTF